MHYDANPYSVIRRFSRNFIPLFALNLLKTDLKFCVDVTFIIDDRACLLIMIR